MRAALLAAALLASCFSPSYREDLACGPGGDCPPGLICASDDVCRDEDAIDPGDSPPAGGDGSSGDGTFSDPTGDADGDGLDVGMVTASLDMHSELTMHIELHGLTRSTVKPGDALVIAFDADQDGSTGPGGFEYRIVLDGTASPPFFVEEWTDSLWSPLPSARLDAALRDGGIFITLGGALLDNDGDGAFDFIILTTDRTSGSVSDLAPDGAPIERFSYQR